MEEKIDDEIMQNIAAENNLAETAFVLKQGDGNYLSNGGQKRHCGKRGQRGKGNPLGLAVAQRKPNPAFAALRMTVGVGLPFGAAAVIRLLYLRLSVYFRAAMACVLWLYSVVDGRLPAGPRPFRGGFGGIAIAALPHFFVRSHGMHPFGWAGCDCLNPSALYCIQDGSIQFRLHGEEVLTFDAIACSVCVLPRIFY